MLSTLFDNFFHATFFANLSLNTDLIVNEYLRVDLKRQKSTLSQERRDILAFLKNYAVPTPQSVPLKN